MRKLGVVLSLFNVVLFTGALMVLLFFTNSSDEHFPTKGGIVFYFLLYNIVSIIPAFAYLGLILGKIKRIWIDFLSVILNIGALMWLFPQFKAFVFG